MQLQLRRRLLLRRLGGNVGVSWVLIDELKDLGITFASGTVARNLSHIWILFYRALILDDPFLPYTVCFLCRLFGLGSFGFQLWEMSFVLGMIFERSTKEMHNNFVVSKLLR